MRLRSIDLNLMVVFDALVTEKSVSRAAARLGLTQSAVSHSLRRLRVTFDDVLLIRSKHGLELTARAVEAIGPIREALDRIETTVAHKTGFDPASARRRFRLHVTEYVSGYLLERLAPKLRAEAPGVGLDLRNFTGEDRDGEIAGDSIHIRLATGEPTEPGHCRLRILDEQFVVLFGRDSPAAAQPMTVARYAELSHVKISPTVGTHMIDNALKARGLERNVVYRVPTWRDAQQLAAHTDLIATMPARWARTKAGHANCATAECPLDDVSFAVDMVWHARYDADPGHRWLRGEIKACLDHESA